MTHFRSGVGLLACLLCCSAQSADEISKARMHADLEFLASDALEGRLSLRPGSEVAIAWLASEFAKAGLRPVSGDSFLQPVALIEYRMDRNSCKLIVERGDHRQNYDYGSGGFTGGFPQDLHLHAPVAFAGFGITAPEYGYDDYAGLDVRGKAVLVFDHEPQEADPKSVFNGTGNTRYASSRLKALNAQARGAVALLVASEPNRTHPTNAERAARVPGSQARNARLPTQTLADSEVHVPILTVSDGLAADLLQVSGRKPADLQRAIDQHAEPHSLPLPGTEVELRLTIAERRRGVTANVVGMVDGADPALRKETILFTAHHDHNGSYDGGIFHGADDNGSGTVGVVELARAFARSPEKTRRTLVFAVFAAEERGLLGSYYYTAHPLRPLAGTRAVINFDMIGRDETPSAQTEGLREIAKDTSNELNLIGTNYSPDYLDTVESANRSVGLKLNYTWDRDAALNIFQRSDQFPFAAQDIPAVWWFTAFHPDYHQTTDTVDKINFDKMERIVRLAYLAGRSFANTATPPRFEPAAK